MQKFIEHPYVGQIVMFNPEKLKDDDFDFYSDGGYFDYTYMVGSAIASSFKKDKIILQPYLHAKIAGKNGHPALSVSLQRKRKINIGAEKMIPILQSNRGYAALLEKED